MCDLATKRKRAGEGPNRWGSVQFSERFTADHRSSTVNLHSDSLVVETRTTEAIIIPRVFDVENAKECCK